MNLALARRSRNSTLNTLARVAPASAVLALGALAGTASAQTGGVAVAASSEAPQAVTLTQLQKPVTVEFKENRLEEVIRFVTELTGADIEPLWADDANPVGLDKEKQITLKANGISALKLIERVLEKATDDGASKTNTWQMTEGGAIQIGPKARLNNDKRLQIYDINDLLMTVPDYTNAPTFDLNSVLQSTGQGGGSGSSPFQQNNRGQQGNRTTIGNVDVPTREERADELIKLIQQYVESEEWIENGGSGGSAKWYQGSIIINAADYIHRQINGYPYWPSRQTSYGTARGRRYVSINGSATTNTLDGFGTVPVNVPGR